MAIIEIQSTMFVEIPDKMEKILDSDWDDNGHAVGAALLALHSGLTNREFRIACINVDRVITSNGGFDGDFLPQTRLNPSDCDETKQ